MRLTVTLSPPEGSVVLPVHYNQLLQGALYHCLGEDGAFYHDDGFRYQKRSFKMFCFSRLVGKAVFDKESGFLRFDGAIKLIVTSPSEDFCSSLASGLLRNGIIYVGGQRLLVSSLQTSDVRLESEVINVRTLSPVVAYATMIRYSGEKYTCYFAPGDPDFESIVSDNLRRKYLAFTGIDVDSIAPLKVVPLGRPRLSVVTFKGTVIKGYTCRLHLEGPTPLLQMALDAGLGSKNSQGFGCLELEECTC